MQCAVRKNGVNAGTQAIPAEPDKTYFGPTITKILSMDGINDYISFAVGAVNTANTPVDLGDGGGSFGAYFIRKL
jgi:hypothetical protein